ncbi:MAG: radical SAM protein [Gammaproteobacteria bacterium]|nr:radical SAM protein [Gammaproteobacteria bacterium]
MPRTFRLILIKPSRYDDDGYVVQWRWAIMPSNVLTTLHALAMDCAERRVLGPEVEIVIEAFDDHNGMESAEMMAARIGRASDGGMVALVGIYTAQFPRAADLARRFRALGAPVVMGGFHVSGALANLPELPLELREMRDLGVSLFAGEAEGRMEQLVRDAHAGVLAPVYSHLDDLVDLAKFKPPAAMTEHHAQWMALSLNPIDTIETGRGCPFKCTFCAVINIHGRRMRPRMVSDITALVRDSAAKGRERFWIVDDNFARNPKWREILEALARLREEDGFSFEIMLQTDVQSDRIPDFIPLAARAGCTQVFVGLESINPDTLASVGKKHNAVGRYKRFLLAWKRYGVITMAGYIIGFPNDTPESVRRDIDTIKRELPLDLLYPFILTPLPGASDYAALVQNGVPLASDLSLYSSVRATIPHPHMSGSELESLFHEVWARFYDAAHCARIMRRHVSLGGDPSWLPAYLMVARGTLPIEGVHPTEYGIFRLKQRRERRPDLPREALPWFAARRAWEILSSQIRWGVLVIRTMRLSRQYSFRIIRVDVDDPALWEEEVEPASPPVPRVVLR